MLRITKLCPWIFPRHHIARLFGNRTREIAAQCADFFLGLSATHGRERAGEDKSLPREWQLFAAGSKQRIGDGEYFFESPDERFILWCLKPSNRRGCHHRSNAFYCVKILDFRLREIIDAFKILREEYRGFLANVRKRKSHEQTG